MEQMMDKRRILEIYLNVVEWGDGVFGAEAAARHYFGVGASALSAEQAAQLAAMLPSPRYYDRHRQTRYLGRRGEASYDRARPRGCEEFALHRRDIDAARCGELLDERAHALRRGRPGQHAVDRDAGALQRLRQPARDCELRGLGDAVMNHLRGYLHPGLTRYEHDASPAAGAHVLHVMAREAHAAHHVGLK